MLLVYTVVSIHLSIFNYSSYIYHISYIILIILSTVYCLLPEDPRREPSTAIQPVDEAELFGMHSMDDDGGYAGFNDDDNDDYGGAAFNDSGHLDDPPSSLKKDTSRRVSFGADVKEDKKRKLSLKVIIDKLLLLFF